MDDANTWTFSFESNFGQGDTISVMVESGSNTFTIGTGSDATTVTETRKHLMSENWDHYGGKEVRDGETVQWNANWERGAAVFDVSSGAETISQSSTAYSIYGDGGSSEVYYREETWDGYYGTETETTYYDANGTKLGSSWSGSSTWQDGDGNTITNASTNYNGPDWEWLGSSWSDTDADGNVLSSGSNFETVVAKYETNGSTLTSAWTSLTSEFTWLQDANGALSFTDANGDEITSRVNAGSATWTEGQNSVTETRKHIMSDNWDHLGGKEVRDGQTTQFSANWERGASSISSDALNSMSRLMHLMVDGRHLLRRYTVMVLNTLRMSLRVGMVR